MTDTITEPTVLASMEERAAYAAGLRALADALDGNPDLPLPFDGTTSPLSIFVHTKPEAVAFARLMHGQVDKHFNDNPDYGFQLLGAIHGLRVRVWAPRAEVCERVVVGTREITREVPDPDALAAVPMTMVVETVEDVVWECHPLLAGADA